MGKKGNRGLRTDFISYSNGQNPIQIYTNIPKSCFQIKKKIYNFAEKDKEDEFHTLIHTLGAPSGREASLGRRVIVCDGTHETLSPKKEFFFI